MKIVKAAVATGALYGERKIADLATMRPRWSDEIDVYIFFTTRGVDARKKRLESIVSSCPPVPTSFCTRGEKMTFQVIRCETKENQ